MPSLGVARAETWETTSPLGRPGDLGWIVSAHGQIYAAEFGSDTTFEAPVTQILVDCGTCHGPDREGGWIAEYVGWLVNQRLHGAIGHLPPDEHEAPT